jgi:hypothetical protein
MEEWEENPEVVGRTRCDYERAAAVLASSSRAAYSRQLHALTTDFKTHMFPCGEQAGLLALYIIVYLKKKKAKGQKTLSCGHRPLPRALTTPSLL